MKILFLSAWCPLPADNGSKLRISNLLRQIGKRHQIDLLSFAPTPPPATALAELRTICNAVDLLDAAAFPARGRGDLRRLLSPMPRSLATNFNQTMVETVRARARHGYDLVIASQLHMAPYALALPGVPRLLEEIELVIMRDHVTRQRTPLKRARATLTWLKLTSYLRTALRQFAGATVVSAPERDLLRQVVSQELPIAVVPNGVDLAAYNQDFGLPEADTLIHPGALSWEPNLHAMQFFLSQIWPRIRTVRPQTRLRITGKTTPEQIAALPPADGVEFTGFLDDVRPAISRSWAVVVPLTEGGGTRLKVLEALAIGTPLVSTSKGCEGIALVPDRDLLLANSPAEFAAQTLRLLANPELRGRLASQGRAAVARYDWAHCSEPLESLIEQAARMRPTLARP